MFENLSERLLGTIKKLRGQGRLTENNIKDALREVRKLLPESTLIWLDKAEPAAFDFDATFEVRDGRIHGMQLTEACQAEYTEMETLQSSNGEIEQLACQSGAIFDILLDIAQLRCHGIFRGGSHEHQRNVALHTHEDIVEVMGDPARQGADGLHALGVVKLFFQFLSFFLGTPQMRDIPQHTAEPGRWALLAIHHGNGNFQNHLPITPAGIKILVGCRYAGPVDAIKQSEQVARGGPGKILAEMGEEELVP